jgi:DNA-binding response OmpR family regulator
VVFLAYDRVSSGIITSELEKAGYRIRITSSIGETIFCLREAKYAALIVGPLVQANDKMLLASELKRRNSTTKIVFLYRDGQKTNGTPALADAVLNVQNGADTVVRTLKKLLVSN